MFGEFLRLGRVACGLRSGFRLDGFVKQPDDTLSLDLETRGVSMAALIVFYVQKAYLTLLL